MKRISFNNKVVWITGASSGIGASMARQLNQQGATVVASARRAEKLQELKQSCTQPERLICVPMNITDQESIDHAVSKVRALDRLDLLVHNAGIAQKGLVTENQMAIDRAVMETNYFGTVALTKAVMPLFLKQGHGWFGVMSSFAGVMGIPGRSAYAASKHALHGFFESLKAEKMACKLKVSFIIPGFINTQITAKGLRGDGVANGAVETSHRLGMTADQCAKDTIKGLQKGKARIPVGKFEVHLLKVNRLSPRLGHFIIRNHPMKRIRKVKSEIGRMFRFNIMPFIRTSASLIALVFSMLMLLQSCSVYRSDSISKEQASFSKVALKLKIEGENYKIKSLKHNDSSTLVVTKRRSKIAKSFPELIVKNSGKRVTMDLTDSSIESIKEKNNVASALGTAYLIGIGATIFSMIVFGFPSVSLCC